MSEQKKKTKRELRIEIRKKMSGYIVGGLAVVGGLAWNDAIKTLIEMIFPQSGTTVVAKVVYAVLLTVIIVVAGFYVTRILERDAIKAEEERNND